MDNVNQPSGNKLPIIIAIVVVVIVIIVVGIVLTKSTGPNGQSENEQKATDENVVHESNDGFPTVFYSYTGIVEEIGDSKIVILASKDKNYVMTDTRIMVELDDETVFSGISVSATQPETEAKLLKRENISLSAIEVGDVITVISYDNVKGKTEFTAKKVEKMVK